MIALEFPRAWAMVDGRLTEDVGYSHSEGAPHQRAGWQSSEERLSWSGARIPYSSIPEPSEFASHAPPQAGARAHEPTTIANPFATTPFDAQRPLLSVIIPVFNEVSTIDELLRRVAAASYEKQVIVVDDGSTDGSSAVIADWEARRAIEVCRHARNRGKGRAIRTALERARGRFTIIQDGDLETDPRDYPRLVEPLRTGKVEIVLGSRFLRSAHAAVPIVSLFRVGVVILNVAVRFIYGVRLSDEACCYKVLRTETLKAMNLECEGFEFCPEVVAKACRMGLRIEEVGIGYVPRSVKDGKKIRIRDGLSALRCLWKLRRWMHSGPHDSQSRVPHFTDAQVSSSRRT